MNQAAVALAVALSPFALLLILWGVTKLPEISRPERRAEIERYMSEHRALGVRAKLAKFRAWEPTRRVVDWTATGLTWRRPPAAILEDQAAVKAIDRALERETLLLERRFPPRATYGEDYDRLWQRLLGSNPLGLKAPRVLVGSGARDWGMSYG